MKPRVLIGPAHLYDIQPVFAPPLREAGYDLVFPKQHIQMVESQVLEHIPGCVASLAGSEPYTRKVIETAAANGLKVLSRAGVGYDAIDVKAATDNGVAVAIAVGANHDAVAEQAVGLLIALAKQIVPQHNTIRNGGWPRKAFGHIRGKTLGVVGLGRTGKAVVRRAKVFDLTIIAHDPYAGAEFAAENGVRMVPMDELFSTSDFVTLHTPLTHETRHLIGHRTLSLMKPTAYLVNTSRGGVVNEPELFEAMSAKRIAGVALDVLDVEPPAGNPLTQLDNVLFTAHTAGVDHKSRNDMASVAAANIVKILNGEWPAECIMNPDVKSMWTV